MPAPPRLLLPALLILVGAPPASAQAPISFQAFAGYASPRGDVADRFGGGIDYGFQVRMNFTRWVGILVEASRSEFQCTTTTCEDRAQLDSDLLSTGLVITRTPSAGRASGRISPWVVLGGSVGRVKLSGEDTSFRALTFDDNIQSFFLGAGAAIGIVPGIDLVPSVRYRLHTTARSLTGPARDLFGGTAELRLQHFTFDVGLEFNFR